MNIRNSATLTVNRIIRRRGIALLLVVVVLALAAVLGFAMLSSASIRHAASGNTLKAASAEGLAESGIELACYYLVNPQNAAPSVPAGSFWSGGNNITLGAGVPGSIDVAVTQLSANKYKIVSTGKAENSIRRTMTAEVLVDGGFQVNHGAAFSGNALLTLNSKIYGDVQVKGLLTNLGLIDGIVFSNLLPGGTGLVGSILGLDASPTTHLPSPSALRSFATYSYDGNTYSAVEITAVPAGTTLGPTAANPAGVYICRQPLYLYNNSRINGTLVLESGATLNISGSGTEIKAADGFPALIAKSDVFIRGPGTSRNLKIDGLAWIGGSIKQSGLLLGTNMIEIDGAVLFGNGGSMDALYLSHFRVNYKPDRFRGVNLSATVPPAGIKVTSFK